MKNKRKICVVTNARADYTRLRSLLFELRKYKGVELSLCVAGSHLLSVRGKTIDEIEKDGFSVSYRLYTEVDGHELSTMTKSTGLAIIEFSSYFENNRPDIVVVHGDRFEAFAAATAASMMNIHVAHIQGGEITGTIDEHLRHAITKLSHIHYPSDAKSKERIINLGEDPKYVFNLGCPSSDVLLAVPKYTFSKLKTMMAPQIKKAGWLESLTEDFILLVQHPVTTAFQENSREMAEVLKAVSTMPQSVLMLWPNIDAGAELIVQEIKKYERDSEKGSVVNNFPMDIFINIMRHARVIVGNSSLGVREASYFGTPVVNIGTRQRGRLRTRNVLDVPARAAIVRKAIEKQLAHGAYRPEYPYGKGDAGKRIAQSLATLKLGNVQKRLVERR